MLEVCVVAPRPPRPACGCSTRQPASPRLQALCRHSAGTAPCRRHARADAGPACCGAAAQRPACRRDSALRSKGALQPPLCGSCRGAPCWRRERRCREDCAAPHGPSRVSVRWESAWGDVLRDGTRNKDAPSAQTISWNSAPLGDAGLLPFALPLLPLTPPRHAQEFQSNMSKVPVVITRSLQMIRMLDNKVGEPAHRLRA